MGQQSNLKVVIIGGGFGGLSAARALDKASVEITLIDRRNFHLFQPLLYQVATGGLSPADISFPLRAIFKKQKNIKIVLGEVIDIDTWKGEVVLPTFSLSYDILIISAGAQYHYFGNNSWKKYAPGLKSIEDATFIRSQILRAFERSEFETDPHKQAALLSFLIIGGGPTGVELAGAIAELARETLLNDFRNINPLDARIIIIESQDRILPPYPPELSIKAAKSLQRLGVEIMTNSIVTHVTNQSVTVKSDKNEFTIPASTMLWAAGVKATGIGELLSKTITVETDKAGRIIVQPDCSIPGADNIFIIGDLAHFKDKNENVLPGLAPVAMQQGRYVGKLIKKRIKNRRTIKFQYKDKGNLAVIGRSSAVAFWGKIQLWGFTAWLLWVILHLLFLVGFENRLLVCIQWAFNYFTRNRSARLITGEKRL
jgi:NADH dehydrogenase